MSSSTQPTDSTTVNRDPPYDHEGFRLLNNRYSEALDACKVLHHKVVAHLTAQQTALNTVALAQMRVVVPDGGPSALVPRLEAAWEDLARKRAETSEAVREHDAAVEEALGLSVRFEEAFDRHPDKENLRWVQE